MTNENGNGGPTATVIIKRDTGNALGIASFVFGLISIFIMAPVFVPLAVIVGIIAVIKKQLAWGILGLVCSVLGFATSPILVGLVGLATIGANLQSEAHKAKLQPVWEEAKQHSSNIPAQSIRPPETSSAMPKQGVVPNAQSNIKWEKVGARELPVINFETQHWHMIADTPGTYQVIVSKTQWSYVSQQGDTHKVNAMGQPCEGWKAVAPEFFTRCQASGANYGELVAKNLATNEIFHIASNPNVVLPEGSGPLVVGLSFPEPRDSFFVNILPTGTFQIEVRKSDV